MICQTSFIKWWSTTQTMCYTVCMECQQSKTLVHFFHFSWMLYHSDTHFVMCWLFLLLLKSSYFIGKYVFSLWTWGQNLLLLNVFWLALKHIIMKCIVIHSTLRCLVNYFVSEKGYLIWVLFEKPKMLELVHNNNNNNNNEYYVMLIKEMCG